MNIQYVLCRPLGGVNDMVSQIARTLDYAKRTGRELIVETESNQKFAAPLSSYFDCQQSIHSLSQSDLECFDNMSVFPVELAGRVSTYVVDVANQLPFRDSETKVPVTFDFQGHYSETLLIHHQPGGGLNSTELLDKLTFNSRILAEVERRKGLLGSNYSAVHIRDSDYKTDWLPQILEISSEISGNKVFIATDNQNLIKSQDWKNLGLSVWCSEDFTHSENSFDDNEETLIDLALLAEANEFYVLRLMHSEVTYSGFSLLAKYLWYVRKIKREGLIGVLGSRTKFTDFHHAKNQLVRLAFFYLYWMPRILKSSTKQDFLGR